jgi:3-hydroxyisobutyrate dehydrogenase-like beta-hydroxyacid dehydrogenase
MNESKLVMDKPRVGHVGLGVVGGGLARRLLREHALTVFDLSPERRAEFADLGATVVRDAASCTDDDLIKTDLVYKCRCSQTARLPAQIG